MMLVRDLLIEVQQNRLFCFSVREIVRQLRSRLIVVCNPELVTKGRIVYWPSAMESGSNLIERLQSLIALRLERVGKAKAIADAIREHGSHRWVGLYEVDAQQRLVSNLAWSGPAPPKYLVFPITSGLTSRAIAEKRLINVGDVATDPDYLTALDTTRSEIIVPVLSTSNQVIGTLDVESEHPEAFGQGSERLFEECAVALRAFWLPKDPPSLW